MTNTFFNSIEELNQEVISICKQQHPDDLELIFMEGSFVYGTPTKLSDVDYTATVSKPFKHSKFLFKLLEVDGVLRLVSVYFFTKEEYHLSPELIEDEDYLWNKGMMPLTKFIYGNQALYDQIKEFYANLTYTRPPKGKTIHKSFGKLLELTARVKKWESKNNAIEMAYYGQKIAEHVRRLIVEINGPMSLKTENEFLEEHYRLAKLPTDFETLYPIVACLDFSGISKEEYREKCKILVHNTIIFLKKYENLLDPFSQDLINNPRITEFIELH